MSRIRPCSFSTLPDPPTHDDGSPHRAAAGAWEIDRLRDDETARAERARTSNPFLNTRQAAHYLGLSTRLLERMRSEGAGPRFRRHRRFVRYHVDDLIAWSEAACEDGRDHG